MPFEAMHLFDSFVAREDCLENLDVIRAQPYVKHLIRMPRDWVFYEYHHQLFKDPDFLVEGVWREKMERSPELLEQRKEMLAEQRLLLTPWYNNTRKLGDADALLASEICPYRINSLTRLRRVDFLPCPGWGAARSVTITLEGGNGDVPGIVDQLVEEWRGTGSSAQELEVGSIEKTGTSRVLSANCSYYIGHWLVIFWVLLSDGRWNSQIRRMRIMAQ